MRQYSLTMTIADLLDKLQWNNIPELEEPHDSWARKGGLRVGGTSQPALRTLGSNRGPSWMVKSHVSEPLTRGIAPDWTEEITEQLKKGASSDEVLISHADQFPEVLALGAPYSEEKTSSSKAPEVTLLEQILTQSYNQPITITRIRQLPMTRKEVKEVHFHRAGSISKVWVFKADPDTTARELTAYKIIYEQGIPTGKPLGYDASDATARYPFDIAILGGVIEHAGDSYNELLENMELQPQLMQEAALGVARLAADYHVALTKAKDEFAKYGIAVAPVSIRNEVTTRFVAGLGLQSAEELIAACENLYAKQQNRNDVVSHGDLHTGNVVTIKHHHDTSIKEFGVIDWGSLVLDKPYGDLLDFWLHHQRQAQKVSGKYDFAFNDLEKVYAQRWMEQGTTLSPFPHAVDYHIQSMLWNLYEMYDPVRKDKDDIERKARTHAQGVWNALALLELSNMPEASRVRKELTRILERKEYLKGIMN